MMSASATATTTKSASHQAHAPVTKATALSRVGGGHKCCGCCCDMKTAVTAVDIISVFFSAVVLFLWVPGMRMMSSDEFQEQYNEAITEAYDDDHLTNLFHTSMQSANDMLEEAIPIITVASIVSLFAFSLGIFGSTKIKIWPVAIALFAHVGNFAIFCTFFLFVPAIISFFFAYPHVIFIVEVRKGILSNDVHPSDVSDDILPEIEATPVTTSSYSYAPKAHAYENEDTNVIV